MVNDFIFELGCEELPSKSVRLLADELANNLLVALDKAQLSYGEVERFATPRRIALVIHDLQSEQPSQIITKKGPALAAAFDKEGHPTTALLGFAKSCGVDCSLLSKMKTDKGEWMVYEHPSQAIQTSALLPLMVTQSLAALPIPKPMRWGEGDNEFARPVHWAVMLYGDQWLDHTLLGIKTGCFSRGHRFLSPHEVLIESAKTYESQMKQVHVMADFSVRRALIKEQIEQLASAQQAIAIMPDELLDEVTSIVEWPHALLANFEQQFLDVPAEALIASMQSHQKCFALKDKEGHLLPYFITVANIVSTNPEQVISGNEKVMRARLSDAAFFFKQDKREPLNQCISLTQHVIFQTKLGTLYDKSLRMKALMPHLSQALNLSLKQAERASELSKCDLLTGMVGEFPELQGLMGYYYALHDGEDKAVAQALNEQYMPRFAADDIPKSGLGMALSLADRIDTLVGVFAIGQKPSGVKDPFKLRRHALAVVRMLVSSSAQINLSTLIDEAFNHYGGSIPSDKTVAIELKFFILERLNSYYQSLSVSLELVWAVRAKQDEWFYDLDKRLNALKLFITMPEAATLSAACKRVNNLLNHVENKNLGYSVDKSLLQEAAEKNLYAQILNVSEAVEPLYRLGDYGALLRQLAELKEPIDAFFDQVMVMVDEESLKRNRLALLHCLSELLQGVADMSLLQLT